jgi:hypothetical protein
LNSTGQQNVKKHLNALNKISLTTPILQGPMWDIPFHIHIDASNKEIGVVLGQQEDKIPFAVYFIINNLSSAKLNYSSH